MRDNCLACHGPAGKQRIATPRAAIANGADYLVIGRPITGARDLAIGIPQEWVVDPETGFSAYQSRRTRAARK